MVNFNNVRISVPLKWLLNGYTYKDKKPEEKVAFCKKMNQEIRENLRDSFKILPNNRKFWQFLFFNFC